MLIRHWMGLEVRCRLRRGRRGRDERPGLPNTSPRRARGTITAFNAERYSFGSADWRSLDVEPASRAGCRIPDRRQEVLEKSCCARPYLLPHLPKRRPLAVGRGRKASSERESVSASEKYRDLRGSRDLAHRISGAFALFSVLVSTGARIVDAARVGGLSGRPFTIEAISTLLALAFTVPWSVPCLCAQAS